MDSTDGCLVFEWRSSPRSSNRQRYMYLEKFTGVLPHLPRDKIARFPTMVSSNHGLVVAFMERLPGGGTTVEAEAAPAVKDGGDGGAAEGSLLLSIAGRTQSLARSVPT